MKELTKLVVYPGQLSLDGEFDSPPSPPEISEAPVLVWSLPFSSEKAFYYSTHRALAIAKPRSLRIPPLSLVGNPAYIENSVGGVLGAEAGLNLHPYFCCAVL